MNTLPEDEQRAVWHETERNFWQTFHDQNSLHHDKCQAQYLAQTSGIAGELAHLTDRRNHLTHRQERLSKELSNVEEELARVAEACDNKATVLYTLEQDYRKSEQDELGRRGQIATRMEGFFRKKQERDHGASPRLDRQDFHDIVKNTPWRSFPNRDALHAEALQQANEVARSAPTPRSVKPEVFASKSKPGNVIVDVVDFEGNVIGPLEEMDPCNQWIEAIQDVPIRRPVKIRRGRKFTRDHLATIYDRSEPKGVKWIACMIQATGQVQQQRCHSCDKNQGAFDDCIILGGPLFQKCGNCEWNRQGCHMITTKKTSTTSVETSRRAETLASKEPPPPSGQGHDRPTDRPKAGNEASDGLETTPPSMVKEDGFSNFLHQYNHQQQQYAASSGLIPANLRSQPRSDGIRTPNMQSAEYTSQPAAQAEVTRSNLILRHNGVVYTYPECVEGVPLAKIDERHPYWDPRWPPVQSIIMPQLERWIVKYNEAVEKKAQGQGGSAKELNGRQVHRGNTILEFLERGEISPYQLLSKKYTRTGKGNITAYDTLFRMCRTLEELGNFRLDVSPVEWLRHRLHEIILEEGESFKYSTTMHDFYHDPKLSALREKNGFKSIGRPSGFRVARSGAKGANDVPSVKKRKRVHPQTDTPRATPSASHSPLAPHKEYSSSPVPNRTIHCIPAARAHAIQTRLENLSPVSAPTNDEFHADDFTDADSWSGVPLHKLDWRVFQVKTRLFTSHTDVRQYWEWKEDKRAFQYRVLNDTKPVAWSLPGADSDFNVPLDDIVQVDWNIDALQMHVVMSSFGSLKSKQDGKPRGDVMAAFKRETTMRRFLSYCRQRRLKLSWITALVFFLGSLVRKSMISSANFCTVYARYDMEQRWAAMQPEKLPMADMESRSALREMLSRSEAECENTSGC